MRKFFYIWFGILILIAASAGAAWAAGAFAAYDIPSDQSEAAAKYWTPERMKNAMPHPTPQKPATLQGPVTGTLEQSTGASGHYPGYDPDRKTNQTGDISLNDAVGSTVPLSGAFSGYDYPPPQTTFFVMNSNYGSTSTPYPYKTIGKVFFKDEKGEDFVCSGASIGGRAVLTAGHCICNGNGTYYTNWIFVPAYKDGKEPFGKWTASSLLTFSSYLSEKDMARDVAFAIVKDHPQGAGGSPSLENGRKLSHEVGYLGFAYGQSRILHWSMFGYPAVTPWTGKVMVETEASYAAVDTSESPNPTGIGTTQLGGCSGGPWIMNFAPGLSGQNVNLANGVNSYSPDGQDLWIYTSYFDGGDTGVQGLYEQAIAK